MAQRCSLNQRFSSKQQRREGRREVNNNNARLVSERDSEDGSSAVNWSCKHANPTCLDEGLDSFPASELEKQTSLVPKQPLR